MILLFNLILSMMFFLLNHPMSMGMILLIQTIVVCLITGLLNMNFWFSYMLFLIMIGGMLVLFIYMVSIASNEVFNYSFKIIIPFILLSIFLIVFINNSYLSMNNFLMSNFSNNLYSFSMMTKYFNFPSINLILLLINYLFITLIAAVSITNIEFGPLRQNY
uniref:NADH-ubiquinone oxidoreductase chain 6 n=1 Tax=Coleoptera sp. ACP-2013 TaxID=2485033 RepID=A0A3G3ME69_9COLE|nr:NADH dehydrogenase subunit 6 [Coleoptera sp. ACP-2013]